MEWTRALGAGSTPHSAQKREKDQWQTWGWILAQQQLPRRKLPLPHPLSALTLQMQETASARVGSADPSGRLGLPREGWSTGLSCWQWHHSRQATAAEAHPWALLKTHPRKDSLCSQGAAQRPQGGACLNCLPPKPRRCFLVYVSHLKETPLSLGGPEDTDKTLQGDQRAKSRDPAPRDKVSGAADQ